MRTYLVGHCSLSVLASRRHLAWVLALFASFSSAQTPASSIHGVVLNSATHEPVPRALVTSNDRLFAALTDDQGRFSFSVPSAEPWSPQKDGDGGFTFRGEMINASKPGFLVEGGGVGWTPGDSSSDGKDITLTLTPEALIIGRVAVPSSGSFDRISVELYRRQIADGRARWLPAGTERARTNGDFRFADLPAGTYKIFTSELLDRDPLTFEPNGQQYGYPPAYYPSATDFSSAAPIGVSAGQTLEVELTPVLQPYYPVKIAIANALGGSPTNVTVALAGHYGPGFSLGAGDQSIEGLLPNGSYTVEAIRYGDQPASGSLTFTVRNAPLRNASLLLIPGGSIPVNLKEESVAPATSSYVATQPRRIIAPSLNVAVSLVPADDFSPLPGSSLRPSKDPAGSPLMLTGVLPGRYWVRVDGAEFYPTSISSNGIDLLTNPLVVAPGGSSAPIDITVRNDVGEINGSIELNSSDPLASLQNPIVYCLPLPDSPGRFTQAGVQIATGSLSFQCPNLPPGGYRILAFDHPQPDLEYHNPEAMRAYESKGPVVHLAGNQKETIRVPLIRE